MGRWADTGGRERLGAILWRHVTSGDRASLLQPGGGIDIPSVDGAAVEVPDDLVAVWPELRGQEGSLTSSDEFRTAQAQGYREALEFVGNESEREFLQRRLAELD